MLARITGFVREVVLAAVYGAGSMSDAFIIAFAIPDLLLVFVGASMAASFISMHHKVNAKAQFARNVMTFLFILGIVFSIVFSIFPEVLVRLFAFHLAGETLEIAVFFMRYMVWTAVFIFFIDILAAQLEIHGAFFFTGIRLIWRNVAVIIGFILGSMYDNNMIVALSPVVGVAFSMLVLSIICRKYDFVYRPYLDLRSPDMKQLFILVGPIMLSTASTQIKLIVMRNFAATLPVGSISFLNYSSRVTGLFIALFGHALFTVLYPFMSKLAANDNLPKIRKALTQSLMYITVIMLPICVGLIVLAEPGIRIMFERGEFSASDTQNTAAILRLLAPLALAGSISPLLMRAFYAIKNTKTPAYLSIVAVLIGIGLNFLLIGPFGAEGLALSSTISVIVLAILLLIALRKKLGNLGLRTNLPELIKVVFATGIMGVGAWFAAGALPLMTVPIWQSIILCAGLAGVSVLAYYGLLILMRSRIALDITNMVVRLVKKRRERAN